MCLSVCNSVHDISVHICDFTLFSDVRKHRMSGRYAFVEKGPLKDDHVIIRNILYRPTTPSPSGKISSSESTLSKLFIRNRIIRCTHYN